MLETKIEEAVAAVGKMGLKKLLLLSHGTRSR